MVIEKQASHWIFFLVIVELKKELFSSGTDKPGTGIVLTILQSFLHFLKAKDINGCLK